MRRCMAVGSVTRACAKKNCEPLRAVFTDGSVLSFVSSRCPRNISGTIERLITRNAFYNVRCPGSWATISVIFLLITTQQAFPLPRAASPVESFKHSPAMQADLLEEIERLNKRFVELKQAGQYDQAIQIAERVLALKEKALGPDHPDVATWLYDLALLYGGGKKDYAKAEPLLERALSIREKALGADHPDVTRSLNMLGAVYKIRGNYAKAELLLERALSHSERALGPNHPQLVIWLNLMAALYEAKRDYAKAEPLYQRALSIREKSLGRNHLDVATSLDNLMTIYRERGDYGKAEPLAQRALLIREEALGPDHPEVARSLNNLAVLYEAKGDYANADPLLERALSLNESALGPNHPLVASSLDNRAVLYKRKGDYAKAEPLLERALSIREKALGLDHPDVATSLNNLAGLYEAKGDYAKAEPLLERALSINERTLGPNHPDVALSLNSLAALCRREGDYVKAELLAQRALSIREKALGPDHPDVANSLDILAWLNIVNGDYTRAEPIVQRALSIRENALGPDHPGVASSLYDLGWLYSAKGDHAKAEPLYQRALSIEERALGPDHPGVAQSLTNLAVLYMAKGDYAKAEPLLQRSLSIYERLIDTRTLEPNHPDIATSLSNLAVVYHQNKDYAKAEPLYQRALSIDERTLGPNHPDVAIRLNNLAVLYIAKGDYAQAEPLYERALSIDERALGPDHPAVAKSLRGLADLYEIKNEIREAIALRARACDIGEHSISLNLAAGSERQKLLYLDTFSRETYRVISLQARSAPNDPTALHLALTTLLRRKGRALDAMTDSLSLLRRRLNPQDRSLLDQLVNTRGQLAKLILGGPIQTEPKQYQASIKRLEQEIEKLETEVGRRSAEFRVLSQPVTIESVRAAIPTDAALVEFASFDSFNEKTKRWGPRQYIAYVLGRQDVPSWVLLGEAGAIDKSINALREALRNPSRKDFKSLARVVDEKVMQPVRKLLGQTKTVLISPDGALNLVPFGALVDEKNRFLIEQYSFTYLTSGRDLLRMQTRAESRQAAILIANPNFGPRLKADLNRGLKIKEGTVESPQKTKTAIDFSQVYFSPLPGTAEEAQALSAILPGATILMNQQATEAAVKQVNGPTILHIATHGFFLEDAVIRPIEIANRGLFITRKDVSESFMSEMRIENPLLRSGLAMAGANLQKSGDDDGILTAMEAAGLDLWGTKLVVLSACDTGVGEVKNGEGVYGLRRALVLAGSETQVMSLWPVSDEGTGDLMVGYYKGLMAGQGRREALRRVQLRMLASENRSHPYYWASFIQSGEWANLDGNR